MLIPFFVVLALLVGIPSIAWGFPGAWALPAIVPAFIAAATFRHVKVPFDQRKAGPSATPGPVLRPGVIVLGGLFAVVLGFGAVVLMWAAAAPSTVVITSDVRIDASADQVWARIIDLPKRAEWSPWIADTEPIGRGGEIAVGSQYRGTLALERYSVPAELVVTDFVKEARFAWHVKPQGGSELNDITESVTLVRDGDVGTKVHYELSYEVPTVLGRVAERIAVRGSVERLAETTTDLLRQRVLTPR